MSVSWLPVGKFPLHACGQLIPAGELVTVPVPCPARLIESWTEDALTKEALTFVLAFSVREHAPVPEQAPDQPLNFAPAAGVALNETIVPELKEEAQLLPQLIPAGLLVTVPLPVFAIES